MKKVLFFLTLMIGMETGIAQPSRETTDAISGLLFMEGVWKGTGWVKMGEKKQQFRETETVIRKLSGAALQLEAFGTAIDDSNSIINDALGIASYNQPAENIVCESFNPMDHLLKPMHGSHNHLNLNGASNTLMVI